MVHDLNHLYPLTFLDKVAYVFSSILQSTTLENNGLKGYSLSLEVTWGIWFYESLL